MSLDKKVSDAPVKRRNFLKKTISTLGSLVLACYLGMACKPPVPKVITYDVTVQASDIFTNDSLGGNIILNGTSKPSGSTFQVEEGKINTLDAAVDGYISSYIVGRNQSDQVIYTRDANGPHGTTVTQNTVLYAYIIPENFDIILLAKCTGDGMGTVQHYADDKKEDIKVKVCRDSLKGAGILDSVMNNIFNKVNEVVGNKFNPAANSIVRASLLEGIGNGATDQLSDGLTVLVGNFGWESPSHGEFLNGNTIYKSSVLIEPTEANSMSILLEEITQALSGIRGDGGTSANPYISLDGWYANDGARAIQLNNLLPIGFKLSTTGIPAVVVNLKSQDEDSMFSTLKPCSPDRRYVLYEGREGARSSRKYRQKRF